jgi:NTP pyrophosphatase (non-canonical NTP hydrolase)
MLSPLKMFATLQQGLKELAEAIHQNAIRKGFYDPPPSDLERFTLMHAEISEAAEGIRHSNPPSEHIPEFSSVEEEMADTIIRILDYAEYRQLRLCEAILAKHEYNLTRTYKHGKTC